LLILPVYCLFGAVFLISKDKDRCFIYYRLKKDKSKWV